MNEMHVYTNVAEYAAMLDYTKLKNVVSQKC